MSREIQAAAHRSDTWLGALAALVGVAGASIVIGLLQSALHTANLSVLYLVVVLWLAARFGRGPAVLASCLAFLTYDFFFVPPLYVFTIADPSEWVSLSALLATAVVAGHLTAVVRARAQEARASQQRTASLFALSQLTVSTTDRQVLLDAFATRLTTAFAPAGVDACAIIVPDEQGRPVAQATCPAEGGASIALSLTARERAAQADWVLRHGSAAGQALHMETSVRQGVQHLVVYVPLISSGRIVGALGLAGTAQIRRLVRGLVARPPDRPQSVGALAAARSRPAPRTRDPDVEFFIACCDQLALALERVALERETIHAAALQESDRLKTALLGSVTHDLRTPLASIRAAAGSLLEPDMVWSESDRHEFLEAIARSADRLSRLVDNLLDLSRLESGVGVPVKRWYPIGDVIATVLDRLDLAGQTAGRRIDLAIPEDLPLVPLDHAQLEQVLTNLLENAFKYAPVDRPIRVSARLVETPGRPPSELEVCVNDQGIGIPPHELTTIFDKFYRVQHVDLPWAKGRPPTGTGLGLAICAGIVQAHGGRIWAESSPATGTTMRFTLPVPAEGRPPGDLPDLPTADDSAASPGRVVSSDIGAAETQAAAIRGEL